MLSWSCSYPNKFDQLWFISHSAKLFFSHNPRNEKELDYRNWLWQREAIIVWWLELADYLVLKSRLLYNTTERSNIWFFLILKTLRLLQFSKPPLAQPCGAEWAGWAHTGIARSQECWPRNRPWAWQQQLPNPGTSSKGWQWHWMPPPTSSALGDLTHCSSQDQTHGKTSYFSEA